VIGRSGHRAIENSKALPMILEHELAFNREMAGSPNQA